MKRLFLALILVLAVSAAYISFQNSDYSFSPAQQLTFENLPKVMSNSHLIKSLSEDSSITLRFYSKTPEEVEHSYIITKASVKQGSSDNVDVIIYLHSKYMSQMTTANICEVIEKARKNKEVNINTQLSKVELAWKFRSLASCLAP